MTAKEYLEQFSTMFETSQRLREGGLQDLVLLKDDAPEWAREIVQEAHGEFLPDAYRYRMIEEVADRLLSYDDPFDTDNVHEACDNLVDVYNHDLLKWLSSNLRRAFYHDDAVEEGVVPEDVGMYQRIMIAQLMEYKEIAYSLIESFNKLAEENDDENS